MPTGLEAKVDDISSPPISQRAARAAHNQGAPSFQEWVTGEPALALAKSIQAPGANWASVYRAMAEYELNLVMKGSGMVVTTAMEGRVLAAKASQLGRWASKAALEKKLGPFRPPTNRGVMLGEKGYIRFLRNCQQGGGVTTSDEDGQRKARREARTQARRELHDRFRLEQQALTSRRKEERLMLQKRHQQEREALRFATRSRRAEYLIAQKATGMHLKIAASLWSFMAALEKEGMQKRQVSERRELSKRIRGTQVWREWLEQQAEKGDEAPCGGSQGMLG